MSDQPTALPPHAIADARDHVVTRITGHADADVARYGIDFGDLEATARQQFDALHRSGCASAEEEERAWEMFLAGAIEFTLIGMRAALIGMPAKAQQAASTT